MENRDTLETRVLRAAEAALSRQRYVSVIDVLCGILLLHPTHVEAWRKGRIEFLEQMIQGNPDTISGICSECGAELEHGEFLPMEGDQGLCLPCARLDDLEFLPGGEVVVCFRGSRTCR